MLVAELVVVVVVDVMARGTVGVDGGVPRHNVLDDLSHHYHHPPAHPVEEEDLSGESPQEEGGGHPGFLISWGRRHVVVVIRLRSVEPTEESLGIHGGIVMVVVVVVDDAMVMESATLAEGGTRGGTVVRFHVGPCFEYDPGHYSRLEDNAFAPTLPVEGVVCDGPILLVLLLVDVVVVVVVEEEEYTVEAFEICASTVCALLLND